MSLIPPSTPKTNRLRPDEMQQLRPIGRAMAKSRPSAPNPGGKALFILTFTQTIEPGEAK